jgi:hypothetical protein
MMASFILAGPFPFDEKNATSSARNALSEVNIALKEREGRGVLDQPSSGAEAGLYIIVDLREKPAIGGFWLVHGPSYLETGPVGPPDKVPPLVAHLLDAATEEVWWKNLLVAGRVGDTWRPRVVLEWPGILAARSKLPPPGVPTKTISDEDAAVDQAEGWMDPVPSIEEEVGGFYGETGGFFGDDAAPDSGDYWGDEVQAERDEPQVDAPTNAIRTLAEVEDPWQGLALQRGLVCVVKGKLTYDQKAHVGTFQVINWSVWREGMARTTTPMITWMDEEGTEEAPQSHGWGSPLEMPGGRVAFPITGWLTRNLEPWPAQPADIAAGALTERDVSNPMRKKVTLAIALTAGNLALILYLAVAVAFLAKPKPETHPPPPTHAPQPALSLCSADHAAFVNEFRCQVRRMADGPDPVDADCGDIGPSAGPSLDDLQASYCGLLDRQQDGQLGNYPWLPPNDEDRKYNYAQLAATQACFNVLDKPYAYTQSWDHIDLEAEVSDPDRFLADKALGIQPLIVLLGELNQACETYRSRLEYTLEGSIVATHVGSPSPEDPQAKETEASKLRRTVIASATSDLPEVSAACFRSGSSKGVGGDRYQELCGEVDALDSYYNNVKVWHALSGEPAQDRDLVHRYAQARFGSEGMGGAPEVWQCHEKLSAGEPSYNRRMVLWSQYAPEISGSGYDTDGNRAVKNQLNFDAIFRDIDENNNTAPGVCWELIEKKAVVYQPVHPLLGELDEGSWVSPEQQLCAQVCASRYNVKNSDGEDSWVTRDSDLGACISREPTNPEPSSAPRSGSKRTDRLLLPWNQSRSRWMQDTEKTPKVERCSGRGKSGAWLPYPYGEEARGSGNSEVWVCPSVAQVCAFNLIAQNYMPQGENGYLVGSRTPRAWAGETTISSQIAGGYPGNGWASTAADNLSSYGRSRSKNTCGHAAAQCFTSLMLETMGAPGRQRYEWREHWSLSIDELAATPLKQVAAEFGPWCAVVHPYMSANGILPEGQIDYPCAMGVDEALRTVASTLELYENDLSAEAGQ